MNNLKLSIIAILFLMTVLLTPTFAQEGDADGDGVLDSQDLCPREKGTKENKGCPTKNADANKKVVQAENPPDFVSSFVDRCVSGNCLNGKGKKDYAIGDTYEGDWVNGKREGQGTQTELFGSYIGQWKNDEYNGYGKLEQTFLLSEFGDDYTYEGNFVNGKREGQGTSTLKNGDLYTGEWKNDKQNGYGKEYIKATMALREGTWKDGVFVDTRAATSTPKNSNQCVSGNCVNGKGKMVYSDGTIYEGDFVNGKKDGRGTLTFKYGQIYIGQFSNDLRDGKGKLTAPNGDIYDGNWSDDKRNGKGKSTYSDGDSYDGNWVDNNSLGQGTYTFKNGDYYTGEWKYGKKNGYGKEYIKATNTTREGTWKDGSFINTPGVATITPVVPEAKFPIDGIAAQLRETLNGKYDYMEGKPLTYIFTNKKTNEVLRYQIEFIEDGGKLAFRWKESTKNEQSGKLVITNTALSSANKFINFFSTKTAIAPDNEIAFILSQKLHKAMKDKKEISLDLGSNVKRLTYFIQFSASSGTYTNKNIKVFHYHGDDLTTKVQILDDPLCPLILKIETAEYTLTLV